MEAAAGSVDYAALFKATDNYMHMEHVQPLPVVMSREGKWVVVSCPLLDIATQGRDEEEAKVNMRDLIEEYFRDPDTRKQTLTGRC